MTGPATHFDPDRFRSVRQRWSSAIEALLGPATEVMLDSAAVCAGLHVLDVAAGAGDQTIRAAARVGIDGSVLATDVAADVLKFAASAARDHGVRNVEFRAMPCEQASELGEAFDAIICRNGLQYLSNLPKGLAELYRVLRPGGRLGAIAWSSAERNGFLAVSFAIVRRELRIPPSGPNDPDPFRLGEDGLFQKALERAGFSDVRVVSVEAPAIFASASEALLFQQEMGGELVRLLEDASDLERSRIWREIGVALQAFETHRGFIGPGELLVGSGAR